MRIETYDIEFTVRAEYEELVGETKKASCTEVLCSHIKDCDSCPFCDDEYRDINLV